MLYRVLHEVESVRGPVSLRELSHKLGVEPSALAGMLSFWVRKGRLQSNCLAGYDLCVGGDCGPSCSSCPLAKRPPDLSACPAQR
jgi:hypothetical protein